MDMKVSYVGGLQFKAEDEDGLSITLDASKEYGGGGGLTPMAAVLAGLGGCMGMDVVAILRNQNKQVTNYTIELTAERSEKNPKVFTHITMRHRIAGEGLDAEAVHHAIESSKNQYCSVFAMLKETAVIDVSFTVEDS